ncbi:hypothetical protein [Paraburkholderia sacchari]|uniref:hypothetical protein n=1 Tax=Paraburkholderia sacchari TaxID=159450 RepID=UPI0005420896|nr:hypothetical protein [Paraburkholderia sacchari]NLP60636.1 hypothetical protein [Paraburkholderia sacchari]
MDSFDYSNGASNPRARPLLALRRSNGGARPRGGKLLESAVRQVHCESSLRNLPNRLERHLLNIVGR